MSKQRPARQAVAAGAKSLVRAGPTRLGPGRWRRSSRTRRAACSRSGRGRPGRPAPTPRRRRPAASSGTSCRRRTRRWRSPSTRRCSTSSHDEMPMQPGRLLRPEAGREGPRRPLQARFDATMPTMWTPYVCVADCDASTAEATRPRRDTSAWRRPTSPGVGRLGDVQRPAGRVDRNPETRPEHGLKGGWHGAAGRADNEPAWTPPPRPPDRLAWTRATAPAASVPGLHQRGPSQTRARALLLPEHWCYVGLEAEIPTRATSSAPSSASAR